MIVPLARWPMASVIHDVLLKLADPIISTAGALDQPSEEKIMDFRPRPHPSVENVLHLLESEIFVYKSFDVIPKVRLARCHNAHDAHVEGISEERMHSIPCDFFVYMIP